MKRGMVYLVGAGPGDAELISLKGKRALQQAEVVIFDRLINPFLLTYAKEDAKLIYCGKQPCRHTLRQEDIQKEILIHARKGKTVVRLKGGDPAVFGRVGEEAELLAEHHIPYEIVPGITAGIAATAYAGVPLTHRVHSDSFAVVTGHGSKKSGTPEINWQALSKGVKTIVFYMGIKHLKTIAAELMSRGKVSETPVLVVQWGTYSKQRTIEGTLANIARKVAQAGVTNPAIIVVGEVVALRSKLAWYDNRRLSGRSILIPGPEKKHLKLIDQVKQQGADVFAFPLLTERATADRHQLAGLLGSNKPRELVFLSAESVQLCLQAFGEHKLDFRHVHSPIYAVDPSVRQTLRSVGIQAELLEDSRLELPVFIGKEAEVESMRHQYERPAEELILTKQQVSQKNIEAFQRLIREQHVNALLITSRVEAMQLLTFLTLSGIEAEICNGLQLICKGKDVKLLLESQKIAVQSLIEGDELVGLLDIFDIEERIVMEG
ncbi:uroporphyrinogen-III C-methyltransferase [Alkalihalobacillus oceani]|uniref:Uroporphyrinogen-III C-methyltransferase n=1 Tax=Halalkalibacter oceani TaxID=1653776 RepID=A0A9X2DPF6_9BACI|nr:uroporphyrinogen-III C-methyltransferase [Halalkalibacter oceani]MCM3714686.1 uroporphyrinogen-III C-methyltransferase [Halalkalibacter oceani]